MTTTPAASRRSKRTLVLGFLLFVGLVGATWFVAWRKAGSPWTIGVEGRRSVVLPGPLLRAAPFVPGDAVSLRIAGHEPVGDGHRYDLRYILYGPGQYDLADHLMDAEGRRPPSVPPLSASVESNLPDSFEGELLSNPLPPISLRSHYPILMGTIWAVWLALLVPLWRWGRRPATPALPTAAPPSIEDRLGRLLDEATRQPLTALRQAELERLFLAWWRERLSAPPSTMIGLVESLRQHPQAALPLARLERWLHGRRSQEGHQTTRELAGELLQELDRERSSAAQRSSRDST